jgi:two-component system sensor histidine kinase TctE
MKLFQRKQPSLVGGILDWMFIALACLWPMSVALTWMVADGIANKPFDRYLETRVKELAHWVDQSKGERNELQSTLSVGGESTIDPNAWARALEAIPALGLQTQAAMPLDGARHQMVYQIHWTKTNTTVGVMDLPMPVDDIDATESRGSVYLRTVLWHGQSLRLGHAWVKGKGESPVAWVQVGETLQARSELSNEIVKGVMLPQFAIIPLAVLLLWMALAKGLAPLQRLEEQIRSRRPDDLSPLDSQSLPIEVSTLTGSINDLLARLQISIETKKKFLADAAHQLKTPLAGLRMQAELAQRESSSAQELMHSLKLIGRSSVRATHTVNQLLALARAESGAQTMVKQMHDLGSLIKEVMQDALPLAMAKHIDLGYENRENPSKPWRLEVNPTLIKEMIRNLLDNAIHYTPSSQENPGVITLSLYKERNPKRLVFEIEDSGPGIAPSERELVFQPFYRIVDSEAEGSGLGLSIVREIAQQHHATVTLESRSQRESKVAPFGRGSSNAGNGLRVKVTFALEQSPSARVGVKQP